LSKSKSKLEQILAFCFYLELHEEVEQDNEHNDEDNAKELPSLQFLLCLEDFLELFLRGPLIDHVLNFLSLFIFGILFFFNLPLFDGVLFLFLFLLELL